MVARTYEGGARRNNAKARRNNAKARRNNTESATQQHRKRDATTEKARHQAGAAGITAGLRTFSHE